MVKNYHICPIRIKIIHDRHRVVVLLRFTASDYSYDILKKLSQERCSTLQEEFEDTKEVIRICKSKKNRQHNGQKKKDKKLEQKYDTYILLV
jgi:hypothetical protein